MATLDEVERALKCLLNTKTKQITVLHCNSAYPTPIKDSNLSGINVLKEMINQIADHEIEGHKNFVAAHYAFLSPLLSLRSFKFGASLDCLFWAS